MKKIITILLIIMAAAECSLSQTVNWRSQHDDQRNVIQLNLGYDFGATTQVSYSRSFTLIKPIMVELDYSMPMGGDLIDDFKVRCGAQVEIVEYEGFSATIKIYSNFRRYQNELVRIVSFGSDFAAVAGYYEPTWHAAGEFGFDKSIISHFKHSDVMKTNISQIHDGWYIPTGGHYYYGIQGSKTLGEVFELSLRSGVTEAQFNDEDAVLPVYVQLGTGVRF